MITLPIRSVAPFLTKNSDDSKTTRIQIGDVTIENNCGPKSSLQFVVGNHDILFHSVKQGSNYSYGVDFYNTFAICVAQEAINNIKLTMKLPKINKGIYQLEKAHLSSTNGLFGLNATHIFTLPFAKITLDQISSYNRNIWGLNIAHNSLNANFVVSPERTASSLIVPIGPTKTCLHIATSSEMNEKAAIIQFLYEKRKLRVGFEHWLSRPSTELRVQFDTKEATIGASLQHANSRFAYLLGASRKVRSNSVVELCMRSDYSVTCSLSSESKRIKGKLGINLDFLKGMPIEPSASFKFDINMNE